MNTGSAGSNDTRLPYATIPAVQPAVVAHRGASAHRAEHTLAAYALALDQGADGLECDVRLSRDGHLVCVHDRTVDRTSNGRGVVSTLTLAELAELDYAGWHGGMPESADSLITTRNSHNEIGVLTLDELLTLVVERPGKTLFVETKHPVRYGGLVEAKLVAMLHRFGLATPRSKQDSQVLVMSFSVRAVRRVRQHAPGVPTVQLIRDFTTTMRDGTLASGADYTGPSIRLLRNDPGYVARAAAHGHPTYCWTVDKAEDVDLCRRLGVRYVATNRPASTREVLAGV
jgi:glycerophosphoryl diester phosphodiesterase